MKVNSGSTSSVQNSELSSASNAKKAAQTQKSKESSLAAKVGQAPLTPEQATRSEISSKAKEMAQAKSIAENTPDVREEKIAALKKRIAEGSYKVDAQAVADKMVNEHIQTAAAIG